MFFFVKALSLAILFVILLQVKISGVTLESHATRFITTSIVTEPIRYTAQNGARAIQGGVVWVSKRINRTLQWRRNSDESNFRSSPFKLNRSESYSKEREEAKAKAEEAKASH